MFKIRSNIKQLIILVFMLLIVFVSGCDNDQADAFFIAHLEYPEVKIQHPTKHPENYRGGYGLDFMYDRRVYDWYDAPIITVEEDFPQQAVILIEATKDMRHDFFVEQAKYQRLRFSDDYKIVRVYYSDVQKPVVGRAFYLVEFIGPGVSNMQTQVLEPWYTKLKRWLGILEEELFNSETALLNRLISA